MLVFAHGIVGRADLPIPAELFGAAAAAVLVLSFAALASQWSEPRLQRPRERRLFRLPRAVDAVAGAFGLAVFLVCVYAGLAGVQAERDNLAPWMVYVAFWVGVPCASLLAGDVWRLLSPWRAIGRAVGAIAGRGGRSLPEVLPYPERLGRIPAAVGLVGFGICELCWGAAREPATLAVLMLVYTVVMLVGMSLYGVEPWSRNADAFGVYFGLFGRLAPIARHDGVLYARPPIVGATGLATPRGTTALILCGIGITAFDGASEGPLFNDLVPSLQDAFTGLGFAPRGRARARLHRRPARRDRARGAALGAGHRRDARAPERAARPRADPDPGGLRRRALLLAARLQRPGPAAAGVGPARRRQRPVRRRGRDDRLRRRVGDGDLVRAGRSRSSSGTSRRSCSRTTGRWCCTRATARRRARRSSCCS